MNKTGWRSRKHFMVYWEGTPSGFGSSVLLLIVWPNMLMIPSSPTLSLRSCVRANIRGSATRRYRLNVPDHSRQQSPTPVRRHPSINDELCDSAVLQPVSAATSSAVWVRCVRYATVSVVRRTTVHAERVWCATHAVVAELVSPAGWTG